MISNLPDDVVHDLLRDIGSVQMSTPEDEDATRCHEFYFTDTKMIIETWEANRDKYLATVKYREGKNWLDEHADELFQHNLDNIERLPDGSGFIVP